MSIVKKTTETHPHLPSGKWEGFYSYTYGPDSAKHDMRFHLTFNDGNISGRGNDDVGYFTWKGTYNLQSMTANLVKFYPTHQVNYQGWVDENGIWGNWNISVCKGGFHIWPSSTSKEEAEKEEVLAKEKRSEAYRKNLQGLRRYIGGKKDYDRDTPS